MDTIRYLEPRIPWILPYSVSWSLTLVVWLRAPEWSTLSDTNTHDLAIPFHSRHSHNSRIPAAMRIPRKPIR